MITGKSRYRMATLRTRTCRGTTLKRSPALNAYRTSYPQEAITNTSCRLALVYKEFTSYKSRRILSNRAFLSQPSYRFFFPYYYVDSSRCIAVVFSPLRGAIICAVAKACCANYRYAFRRVSNRVLASTQFPEQRRSSTNI